MKIIRKIVAVILACAFCMTMSVCVFAKSTSAYSADDYINDTYTSSKEQVYKEYNSTFGSTASDVGSQIVSYASKIASAVSKVWNGVSSVISPFKMYKTGMQEGTKAIEGCTTVVKNSGLTNPQSTIDWYNARYHTNY